jgi:hypothetical protein
MTSMGGLVAMLGQESGLAGADAGATGAATPT